MFSISCIVTLLLTNNLNGLAQLPSIDPGRYDTTWWNRTPVRMIQTHLREIDAMMDVDAFIKSIETALANVVLLNAGGIQNTTIRFKPLKTVKEIMLMRSGTSVNFNKLMDGLNAPFQQLLILK